MVRQISINHISFEISEENVAIIKFDSNSTVCPAGELFKVKGVSFCLCQRQRVPLSRVKVLDNSLRELSIGRKNVLHHSYLYGMMIRRFLREYSSEIVSVELHLDNTLSGYYTCKFIKLEMRVPLRVFSREKKELESKYIDNYESLIDLLEQFVHNSDSSINPLGKYPGYLSEFGGIDENQEIYLGNGQLTVVIPSLLRSEKMLLETLESLVNSKDIIHQLIIIVPELSELGNEIQKILMKFTSFDLLKGSQKGVGFARRLGVEATTNQYVAFIDDDDIVDPSFLRSLLDAHKNADNLAAVGTWLSSFGYSKVMLPQFDNLPYFGVLACLPPAGVLMWNREALMALGNFDEEFDRGFEDFYLTSKACSSSHKISVLDLPLYNYRRHRNSTSAKYTPNFENMMREKILTKRLLESQESSIEILKILYRNDSNLYDQTPFYWTETKDLNRVRNNHLIRFVYERLPYQIRKILRGILRAKK